LEPLERRRRRRLPRHPTATPQCYKRGTPPTDLSTPFASTHHHTTPRHFNSTQSSPEAVNCKVAAAAGTRSKEEQEATPGSAAATRGILVLDNVAAHPAGDRRSPQAPSDPLLQPPVSSSPAVDDDAREPCDRALIARLTFAVPFRWPTPADAWPPHVRRPAALDADLGRPVSFFLCSPVFSRASPWIQIQISRITRICNLMQTLKFNCDKSTQPNFTNFIFLETL
jgi:hypothetical protein